MTAERPMRAQAILAAFLVTVSFVVPSMRSSHEEALVLANPTNEAELLAIDTDINDGGGNPATAPPGLVTICRSVNVGDEFLVDLFIVDVTDLATTMIGPTPGLIYDPGVIHIDDDIPNPLSFPFPAANDSRVWDNGDPRPDTDGDYLAVYADLAFSDTGSGPLFRIPIKAVGTGLSPLRLTDANDSGTLILTDSIGLPIAVSQIQDGYIAVGQPCSVGDSDGDGIPDTSDNCPTVPNGPDQVDIPGVGNQTNTDATLAAAGARLGSGNPPPPLPGDSLGDACDDDDDNDITPDIREQFLGTDPWDNCATDPPPSTSLPPHDAWPPDFNMDAKVNIVDIGSLRLVFNSQLGDGRYQDRFDLNADGKINIVDVGALRPTFNNACA